MKTDKLLNYLFYFSVLVFFIGFNFRDNPQGGWQLQTIQNLNGASVKDITFTDSLTGYAVTTFGGNSSYIIKTTDSGDNWFTVYSHNMVFEKVKFVNQNTGFTNSFQTIFKTTNGGLNWISINLPEIYGDDMFVLNEDTIWLAMSESLTGGVFRTTNGGLNWIRQLSAGNQNPNKIYMYNARIGFVVNTNINYNLRKTTNGGESWFNIMNERFEDIYFIDSLTGWKCGYERDSINKTIDGGLTWINILLPKSSNFIPTSRIIKLSVLSYETILGVGASAYIQSISGNRGLIYKTTNAGSNWGYQLPDINQIDIPSYYYLKFINNLTGWAYFINKGIHTTIGGDTTIYTGIQNKLIIEIPKKFELYQNYPNPFNSMTNVKFQMLNSGFIEIKVYDISGKMLKIITNKKYNAGEYVVRFDAGDLPSGIYFYSLIVDGKVVDTKKATLIK